jgi:Protein of unknown function (DUF2628)
MTDLLPPQKPTEFHDISDEDMALFTGKDWAKYEPDWRMLKYRERPKLWDFKNINWLVMSLAPIWFLYRKMYVSMVAYLGIVYAIDTVLQKLGVHEIPGVVYAVAVTYVSRMLYLIINAKRIRAIRASGNTSGHDETTIRNTIASAGGVNIPAAVIGCLVLSFYLGYIIYNESKAAVDYMHDVEQQLQSGDLEKLLQEQNAPSDPPGVLKGE